MIMENENKKHKSWKTKGRLLCISKEMPLRHLYHAKKDEQDFLNNSSFVHGSNGTYVDNANPKWTLKFKVRHPSYEVSESIHFCVDIHGFITQTLMPKLGWGRMTQYRLDSLNEILSGLTVELGTTDTDKAVLYWNFLPVCFTNWDEYLEQTLLSKMNE
jgi:hypothetical protein